MFIKIADGLSVKVDEVEAVGYGANNLSSKVYTHHNIYDSTFPYEVILALLERSFALSLNQSLKV